MEVLTANMNGLVAIVFFTSFVKIATVLSIVRYGIGLAGSGMGIVVLVLSIALSTVATSGPISKLGGLESFFDGRSLKGETVVTAFSPYIRSKINQEVLARMQKIAQSGAARADTPISGASDTLMPLTPVELSSFLVSEVSAAFAVGLLLVIPFLVVDLIVVNVLMAIGVTQMPVLVVSLPLKLLLFVSLNGWARITERILS